MYLYLKTDYDGVCNPVYFDDLTKAIKTLCWDSVDQICWSHEDDLKRQLRRHHWRKGDLLNFSKFKTVVDELHFCDVIMECTDRKNIETILSNFKTICFDCYDEDMDEHNGFCIINLDKVEMYKRQG